MLLGSLSPSFGTSHQTKGNFPLMNCPSRYTTSSLQELPMPRGGHTQLFPSPRGVFLVFLEEDKGADHDILAAGSVGGRGGVDAGSVERPARDRAVGD